MDLIDGLISFAVVVVLLVIGKWFDFQRWKEEERRKDDPLGKNHLYD